MAALMTAGTGLKAQEATVVLNPGWTWISCPTMDTLDFATALGSFTPISGDIIMSKWGVATYTNGRWRGTISQFFPGNGYMYYSSRTMPVFLTFYAQQPLQVVVTTANPTAITTYGMTCGGEVTNSGSSGVLVRGVCWSTQQNPTINDPHTTDGYGLGSFLSMVEGLEMNTTYYMRAYALTANGAGYGEQVMFTTKNGVPTLTTSAASEIGVTWATCGGDISDDGGMEITERGICWSTTSNPTIDGDHGANGAGLGSFTVNMNGLEANTTYYVRAYATNGYTTAYGNEVSFRTEVAQTWPNGKLPGQFSVSETHQVQFSQGNLQYIGSAATPYWRFAEHQYDYFGTTTGQNSSDQNVDRDLFGWGTSGWDNGNMYYQPYNTEQFWDSNTGYGYGPTDGTNYNYSLTGNYANADWGVYNAILNGGNQTHQWRTMTNAEWSYLFNTRETISGIRYAKAQVYGVNGVVLLPDDWDASVYDLNYTNNTQAPFNSNVIADADWASMESYGAVFLPTTGYRYGTYVYYIDSYGFYWSASCYGSDDAHGVHFYSDGLSVPSYYNINRSFGRSVRLVSVALPEVSTGTVNDVSGRAAIVGGNVTEDGNADISACGICCSTSSNPIIEDMVALAQNATVGEFTVTLNGLTPNTTYYARAFATNSAGTAYGDEISFTTLNVPTWTNGILPGGFSVSANQQVQFSQGNLQYIGSASTPYWQFAENQWDYLGNNGQGSTNQNVDRDLFGWGTSGYDHGANCYQPWSTSTTSYDYIAYGSSTYNLNDSTGIADWGYNAISNGGNQENQWRTLTRQEWNYVFNNRSTTSGIRYAMAQVFGVNGVVLLPDDWNTSYYNLNNTNNSGASFSSNVITTSDWNTLEQHGAVFLPAAGDRSGASVYVDGSYGIYWSASYCGYSSSYGAFFVRFDGSSLNPSSYGGGNYGCSVRLVHSIPVYSIEATPNPAEGGTVTGQGNYNSDATCTLTATPNEGYVFANWTENGTVVSTDASYSFTVTADRTLVANFNLDHTYVDLGLPSGLLWATCNVGADIPEEYGDYFAWGETQPKDNFSWTNYQYCMGSFNTLTKYCNNPDIGYNGFTDDLTTLLPEDDAATANWGDEWRMPTEGEWQELYENTTVTWTTRNGVRGRLFTASNGNSIFMPAAGYCNESAPEAAGIIGDYWTSSLDTDYPSGALSFFFNSSNYYISFCNRLYGRNVRAVRSGSQNNVPTGAINGKFTINADGDQVYFSQGNLQYQASTNTWKFAENQYDYVGSTNGNISSSYSGWIDLFGWGTSGYNHGANCYQPWSTSTSYSDYYAYGNSQYNLYDQTGQADCGYNPISNGGNTANQWRTLTQSEWNYLFNTRTTISGIRYAKAIVNDISGVILLPDDWETSTYSLNDTDSSSASFSSNTISSTQWTTFEDAGAVFLPAAGYRRGNAVGYVGSRGYYWSASVDAGNTALGVLFIDGFLYTDDDYYRYWCRSVRLVCVSE